MENSKQMIKEFYDEEDIQSEVSEQYIQTSNHRHKASSMSNQNFLNLEYNGSSVITSPKNQLLGTHRNSIQTQQTQQTLNTNTNGGYPQLLSPDKPKIDFLNIVSENEEEGISSKNTLNPSMKKSKMASKKSKSFNQMMVISRTSRSSINYEKSTSRSPKDQNVPKSPIFGALNSMLKSKRPSNNSNLNGNGTTTAMETPINLYGNSQGEIDIQDGTPTITQKYEKSKNRSPYQGWEFVRILGKVKRFIDKIKTYAPGQSFWDVTKHHQHFINDKSYFVEVKEKNFIIQYFRDSCMSLGNLIKVQSPDSLYINLWNFMILLFTLQVIFVLPVEISFNLNIQSSYFYYTFLLIPCLGMSFDFILQFNISYYDEGQNIKDRLKIMKNYLKQNYLMDLATLIFLYIHLAAPEYYYITIFFILRIYNIRKIVSQIEQFWEIEQKFPTLWTLVKLQTMLILLAHYCACAFYIIGNDSTYHYNNQASWIEDRELDEQSQFIQYINALYFSFITMTTVGYGDIKPVSISEKMFVIVFTLISSFIFSYTVNTIGSIFQEISARQAKFKKQKYDISNYMRTRHISNSVQVRVRKYLEYIDSKESESPEKGQEIIQMLSKKLKDQIKTDFYGKILYEMKLFRFNFTEEFLSAVSLQMEERLYGPGEMIYSMDEFDDKIYFILRGKVDLFINKKIIVKGLDEANQYIFDCRQEGHPFGEIGFFTNNGRQSNARSVNVSHIVYISRSQFMITLKQFQQDFEKFCEIKDKIKYYQSSLTQRCYGCHFKYGHTIIDCPYMHCIRDKYFLIQKYNHPRLQEREEYDRKRKKYRCLKNRQEIYRYMRQHRKELVQIMTYDSDSDNSWDSYISSDGSIISECDKDFQYRMPGIEYKNGQYVIKEPEEEESELFHSDSISQQTSHESEEMRDQISPSPKRNKRRVSTQIKPRLSNINTLNHNDQQKQGKVINLTAVNNSNINNSNIPLSSVSNVNNNQQSKFFPKQQLQTKNSMGIRKSTGQVNTLTVNQQQQNANQSDISQISFNQSNINSVAATPSYKRKSSGFTRKSSSIVNRLSQNAPPPINTQMAKKQYQNQLSVQQNQNPTQNQEQFIDVSQIQNQIQQDIDNLQIKPICYCRKKQQFNLNINGPGSNTNFYQNSVPVQNQEQKVQNQQNYPSIQINNISNTNRKMNQSSSSRNQTPLKQNNNNKFKLIVNGPSNNNIGGEMNLSARSRLKANYTFDLSQAGEQPQINDSYFVGQSSLQINNNMNNQNDINKSIISSNPLKRKPKNKKQSIKLTPQQAFAFNNNNYYNQNSVNTPKINNLGQSNGGMENQNFDSEQNINNKQKKYQTPGSPYHQNSGNDVQYYNKGNVQKSLIQQQQQVQHDHEHQKNKQLYWFDMNKIQIYQQYLPNNNIDNVIENYNNNANKMEKKWLNKILKNNNKKVMQKFMQNKTNKSPMGLSKQSKSVLNLQGLRKNSSAESPKNNNFLFLVNSALNNENPAKKKIQRSSFLIRMQESGKLPRQSLLSNEDSIKGDNKINQINNLNARQSILSTEQKHRPSMLSTFSQDDKKPSSKLVKNKFFTTCRKNSKSSAVSSHNSKSQIEIEEEQVSKSAQLKQQNSENITNSRKEIDKQRVQKPQLSIIKVINSENKKINEQIYTIKQDQEQQDQNLDNEDINIKDSQKLSSQNSKEINIGHPQRQGSTEFLQSASVNNNSKPQFKISKFFNN